MTRRHSWAALLAASSLAVAGPGQSQPAPAGELRVVVTGLRTTGGELAIALFKSAYDYEQQSNAVRQAWLDVDDDEVVWVVSDLAPGYYVAIAYHDENGNGKLNFGVFGMPREPFGFSNNARGVFGPPRFEAAKFEIRAGEVNRQHVRLW